jgi:hypothetical protein
MSSFIQPAFFSGAAQSSIAAKFQVRHANYAHLTAA